jgi:hypothetical protein
MFRAILSTNVPHYFVNKLSRFGGGKGVAMAEVD